MSKIFVTSDIHFGHENIIRYCRRPFRSAAEMNESIITRWNSRVSEDDTVYFLGDFAFASQNVIIDILAKLNFKKLYIVPGNHDEKIMKMWNHPVEPDWVSHGIINIEVLAPLYELRHDGKLFVMCHYPMNSWNQSHRDSIQLHGHVHNEYSPSKAREMQGQRRYDVGVDMFGGPVQLTGDCRYLNDPKGWK